MFSPPGTYPWFITFNMLDGLLPLPPAGALPLKLLRSGVLGLCAACASDTCANALRVLKTARQTHPTSISYLAVGRQVVGQDGWRGLFGRGLLTRLAVNGVQSTLFAIWWKLLEARIEAATASK